MDTNTAPDAQIFINRELSWLKFNERVLEESMCETTPLYERLKFIAIYTNNLDEFYMIRVGTLYDQALMTVPFLDTKTHMTPTEQLNLIYARTRALGERRDACYAAVCGALAEMGAEHVRLGTVVGRDRNYLKAYFERELQPLLSPQIIDARHPFPHLINKQLYVAVRLKREKPASEDGDKSDNISTAPLFGLIPVPDALDRLIFLPGEGLSRFVLAEEVIAAHAAAAFGKLFRVLEAVVFTVTRNGDINMDEQLYHQDADYRAFMKEVLKKRRRLAPVRLEAQDFCSRELRVYFMEKLRLSDTQIFVSASPIDLRFVYALGDRLPKTLVRKISWEPHVARLPAGLSSRGGMIRRIERGDILLMFPYDSFRPFIDLIREASADPFVTSIKLTLYRVGQESRIIDSLISAAENGKDVTILLELRARFDEENNLNWAQKLEEAGVHILYGPDGYKVHSKVCLITRSEKGRVTHITQVGTGNYNEKTAHVYTDYSLLTAHPGIAADAARLFNHLCTGTLGDDYRTLLVAPHCMPETIFRMIDEEIERARQGREAQIIIKLNSVTDNGVIDALVRASGAGVRVRMIVRGICCVLPGVAGMTENIEIQSIVGRYLEHSRVYCFGAGADRKIYISSADFMTRNMHRRIELAAPILDPTLAKRVYEDLLATLRDNVKARDMCPDGSYVLRTPPSPDEAFDSQRYFRERVETVAASAEPGVLRRLFARLQRKFPR